MTAQVDISPEAVERMASIIVKPLSTLKESAEAAAMLRSLRLSLTARDELLRDAMPPSSTDYNLIAREDWYSKRDAIYGPRPSAVPKAPIPKHLDTQDDWMDNDD